METDCLGGWADRMYMRSFMRTLLTYRSLFAVHRYSNTPTQSISAYILLETKNQKKHTHEQQRKLEARVVVAKSAVNVYANYAPNEKKNSTQAIASTSIKYYDHNSNLLICLANGTEIRRNNTIRILRWAP